MAPALRRRCERRTMSDIVVQGMLGLGDNIHQRAVVRQLMERHRVWLETPWPSVYHDLVGDRLELLPVRTRLRTQAKNAVREAGQYTRRRTPAGAPRRRIWYTHDGIRRHGGFLRAMCAEAGVAPGDFSLPVPAEWRERAQRWIDRWRPDRPLMIYRPLVERTEWGGCSQRNPDHSAYAALARAVRDEFFVVSIADLLPGVEWMVGEDIEADVELHQGQLDFETIAGLMSMAGVVFCSPGFALVLAQAVGAPVVAVFGGHESARLYDHGAPTDHLISPVRPCECFNKSHRCDKFIDLDCAVPALRNFVHGHHPHSRVDQTAAA